MHALRKFPLRSQSSFHPDPQLSLMKDALHLLDEADAAPDVAPTSIWLFTDLKINSGLKLKFSAASVRSLEHPSISLRTLTCPCCSEIAFHANHALGRQSDKNAPRIQRVATTVYQTFLLECANPA